MNKTKPKLIYIIGPNFCVKSLALESLKLMSKKYEIICISEGPLIINEFFRHEPIRFCREPSPYQDLITLFQITKLILINRNAKKIVISTPKISFLGSIACLISMKQYSYLHRGAVYQNFSGFKLNIYRFIDRFVIYFSNKTSFISESLFYWVQNELNLKNIKYERKYNSSKGVDLQKFSCKENTLDFRNLKIGFCGRVARDKGFEDLIALIRKYSDTPRVNIYVKGKIELQDNDKDLFMRMINDKKVYFEAWDENVAQFLHKLDILFFPSKREGFGNVAAEAAACGVPTVGYNLPGIKDAIGNNISGLLFEKNSELHEAVDELINNKNKLKNFRNDCRKFAEENFNQNLVLKDLHNSLGL